MFSILLEMGGLQSSEFQEPESRGYLASMSAKIDEILGPTKDEVADVVPLDGRKVRVFWESGSNNVVDLRPLLTRHRTSPVAASELMFRTVRRGHQGRSIVWDDGSEIGVPWLLDLTLTRMTTQQFRESLAGLGWTAEEAAAHLGVSRRSIAAYRVDQEIPRGVAMSLRFMMLLRARRLAP